VVAGAREEQDGSLVGLDDRRAELLAAEVGAVAGRVAAQVLRGAPTRHRVLAGPEDVTGAAVPGPGRDEVQTLAGERRRAEVRGARVDVRRQALGVAPRSVDRSPMEAPDVVRIGRSADGPGRVDAMYSESPFGPS